MRKSKKIAELENRNAELNDRIKDLIDILLTQRAEIADLEWQINRLEEMRIRAYNDEPPVHSIVMDDEGFAWQRFNPYTIFEDGKAQTIEGWYLNVAACDDEAGECISWKELNLRYGPITILHEAKKENDDAS